MTLEIAELASPIGAITVALREDRLCALKFNDRWPRWERALERRFGRVEFRSAKGGTEVVRRLRAYFDGDIDALAGIAVDARGTPFQERVWSELRKVPPGQTVSYGGLARAIGQPTATRAVGAANGANPVGIVIPCHRAIGSDGRLTGYGGGLERKRWLLVHERRAS